MDIVLSRYLLSKRGAFSGEGCSGYDHSVAEDVGATQVSYLSTHLSARLPVDIIMIKVRNIRYKWCSDGEKERKKEGYITVQSPFLSASAASSAARKAFSSSESN